MSIKSQGGVFGRNPTFNDVTVEGDLSIDGTLTIGGSVITGLNLQGNWDAATNTPDLTVLTPSAGQFWIVSVAGSTNLGGITNWTVGDWALYDGTGWQRVEGGTVDLSNGVTGTLAITNGGTGASTASTARTNLGSGAVGDNLFTATTALAAQQAMDTEVGVDVQPYDATILKSADIGVTVEAYDSTILKSADIGVSVQGYDADTAKYDDTTANFTGTLQNGGSNVVVDNDIGVTVEAYDATILKSADIGSTVQGYDATILKSADIGSTVQAYDADTAKLDVAQTWTAKQTFGATDIDGAVVINESGADVDFRIESDINQNALFIEGSNSYVGVGTGSPQSLLHVSSPNVTTLRVTGDGASTSSSSVLLETLDTSSNWRATGVFYYDATSQTEWFSGRPYAGTDSFNIHRATSVSSPGNSTASKTNALLSVGSSGDLTLSSGNLVIGTAGKGIDFSATAGTGTSELLDDYEEGTFTPVWSFSSGGSADMTGAGGIDNGFYTKIGNTVLIRLALQTDSISSPSGNAKITGLPFSGNGGGAIVYVRRFGTSLSYFRAYISGSEMFFYTSATNAATPTQLQGSDFSASSFYNTLEVVATMFV